MNSFNGPVIRIVKLAMSAVHALGYAIHSVNATCGLVTFYSPWKGIENIYSLNIEEISPNVFTITWGPFGQHPRMDDSPPCNVIRGMVELGG